MGLYVNNTFVPCVKINSAISPINTLSISSNGTYDITEYAFIKTTIIDNLEKRLNGSLSLPIYEDLLITSIAKYAFAELGGYSGYALGCNFPNVITVGEGAFCYTKWTSGIVNLNFPECEYVESSAFYCANMTYGGNQSIIMSFPKCKIINTGAFALGNKRFGSSVLDFPECTYIGASAFNGGSTTITSVYFPKCSYIGSFVFSAFSLLTSVNLPKVKVIEQQAFRNCYALTNISLPLCQSLGYSAFYSCSALSTISLPMCSYISNGAFAGCSNLQSLYLMSTSLVSLNGNVFWNTPLSLSTYTGSFGSIYVPSSLLTAYKSARNWSAYSSRFVGV